MANLNNNNTNSKPYTSYEVTESNWYKSFPYAFKAIIGGVNRLFYLPINPQNITITTHYATNIIATLYSTVEEHSEQRYFDIVIQGTTGFAPKYVNEPNVISAEPNIDVNKTLISSQTKGFLNPQGGVATTGRQSYQAGQVFTSLSGGFFQKTLGQLDQVKNRASDAWAAIQGKTKPFQAGVFAYNSGYLAFHNLYRFFLEYKKSAAAGKSSIAAVNRSLSSTSSDFKISYNDTGLVSVSDILKSGGALSTEKADSPLTFINYKDCNQYSCTISRFTLERSAENPMLYNYSIQLRAYNLKQLSGVSIPSSADMMSQAGLGQNSSSLAARLKTGVRNAKGAINALGGTLGALGR